MPRSTNPRNAAANASKGSNDDTGDSNTNNHRLRRQIDSLHQEMEVAQYGTDVTGHNFTKKLSKKQRKMKNHKRRTLEQQDALEQETHSHPPATKRLRGSRASLDDEVIQGSRIILPKNEKYSHRATDQTEDSAADDEMQSADEAIDDESSQQSEHESEDEDLEDDEEDGDGDAGKKEEAQGNTSSQAKPKKVHVKAATDSTSNKTRQTRKKGPFRMRNFRSIKLAEQHGEALDAHMRGRHKEAIQKLKKIAREAPSAPQIYSSLGMVYCDMLREASQHENNAHDVRRDQKGNNEMDNDETPPTNSTGHGEELYTEQLELAKKAYGAYHVAAILCKKDFALWVRAADLACEVADLYSLRMTATDLTVLMRDHHRAERQRWLNEAKNDYQTADNLRPDGIDVPAKLATVLIELGNLSEALTLMTELKNRPSDKAISPFESSYKAWWLYAGLMLRIGLECDRWNRGDDSNKNYMFRRWLRKHSKTFDWKERRLHALIKAFEAAMGSRLCSGLIEWTKSKEVIPAASITGEGIVTDSSTGDQDGSCFVEDRKALLTREKEILEERSRSELLAFDKTSSEMSLEPGQKPDLLRQNAREKLLQAQKLAMNGLFNEFHQNEAAAATTIEQELPPRQEMLMRQRCFPCAPHLTRLPALRLSFCALHWTWASITVESLQERQHHPI
jgi:hypothetical protein